MGEAGDLGGRTCVITGATSGIGKATARGLQALGARLVLVCRDRAKGEATAEEVAREAGGRTPEVVRADLASQAEVRRAAGELLARLPQIHVLVNNAGVVNLRRELSPDGIEMTWAVNHLAYFLLTGLLLERIVASPRARIVSVASDAHRFAPRGGIRFDDPGFERGYRAMRVYGHSKLANILMTRELARRLAGTGATANCLHPGAVSTGLGTNNGWLAKLVVPAIRPFLRTPERGAATSVFLASSPAVEGVSGRYYRDCREARVSEAARDDAAARRLWQLSAEAVGLPDRAPQA